MNLNKYVEDLNNNPDLIDELNEHQIDELIEYLKKEISENELVIEELNNN
jgi:hypothetical protein